MGLPGVIAVRYALQPRVGCAQQGSQAPHNSTSRDAEHRADHQLIDRRENLARDGGDAYPSAIAEERPRMFIRSSSGTLKLRNLSFLDPDRMDNLWKAHI